MRFDSKLEERRWRQLEKMQEAGEIEDLVLHPEITLIQGNEWVPPLTWVLDYGYRFDGLPVYEDFKGFERPTFKLKLHVYRLTAIRPLVISLYDEFTDSFFVRDVFSLGAHCESLAQRMTLASARHTVPRPSPASPSRQSRKGSA